MGTRGSDTLREPIAQSWRRAELAGLEPGSAHEHIDYTDVDGASALICAAAPVLDALNAQLAGTAFTTLLVDRGGRVAQRHCADAGARRAFDDLGVDVGASLLEEAVGTNAPGTVLETRRGISVHGDEHFATRLKPFSCYGHPIFHPATRRIEGVLDLTATLGEASPLLPPVVARAVADIEQRLLDRSRATDKDLLAAFQASAGHRRPTVAVGHDLVMSNQLALDLLGTTDMALLRMLAADVHDGARVELSLESGVRATVSAVRVGGVRGGALLRIDPHEEPRAAAPAPAGLSARAVLVSGPPGSGRTTRARELASAQPVTVLTAADALLDGPDPWARNFGTLVRARQGTVCVDGVDLLPEPLLELVAAHLATGNAPRIVLVCGPVEELAGRAAALAGECTERHLLAPLAGRLHELPELAARMLGDLGADPGLHLTPGALRALATQPWPGSLRELRAVLDHVVRHRSSGGVVVDDLPEPYRTWEPVRPMGRIERAERDAIVAALHEHDGNKVKAASALGISRTTLYAKMRALRITIY